MWGPRPPGPQVVEQVVADLGLPLVELGEKVQKQREAAVVFLHLAQVPGGGGGGRGGALPGHSPRSSQGGVVCLPHCIPFLPGKGSHYPGTEHMSALGDGGQGSVSYRWMLT